MMWYVMPHLPPSIYGHEWLVVPAPRPSTQSPQSPQSNNTLSSMIRQHHHMMPSRRVGFHSRLFVWDNLKGYSHPQLLSNTREFCFMCLSQINNINNQLSLRRKNYYLKKLLLTLIHMIFGLCFCVLPNGPIKSMVRRNWVGLRFFNTIDSIQIILNL